MALKEMLVSDLHKINKTPIIKVLLKEANSQ